MTPTPAPVRSREQAVADAKAMTMALMARRLELGWSRYYLSQRAHVGGNLGRLETGRVQPQLDTYLRLQRALDDANQVTSGALRGWSEFQARRLLRDLRDQRRRRGWLTRHVRDRTGITDSSLRGFEGGIHMPYLSTYLRVCDALEVRCPL